MLKFTYCLRLWRPRIVDIAKHCIGLTGDTLCVYSVTLNKRQKQVQQQDSPTIWKQAAQSD